MPAQRYSRILGSARYYTAISRYIQHLQGETTRPSRIGQGDPRPASQRLYIDPFSVPLATGQVVKQTAAQPSWTAYQSHFTGRTTATAPTDEDLIIPVRDFKAARVIIRTNMTNNATVKTSGVTGLKYGSYGGKSTSIPFGRRNVGDSELSAFTEIKNGISATLSGNFQISLSKESFAA